MDLKPFLSFSLLDLKDTTISELKKFKKEKFDVDEILNTSEELKYSNIILLLFNEQFNNPSDEFTKYILSEIYEGIKTQNIIEKFKPIVKKTFSIFINEIINDKLKSAFDENIPNIDDIETAITKDESLEGLDKNSKVITTPEEIESYFIIKGILSEYIESKKIVYKDTESYFGILYDNNVRKWICRLYLSDNRKVITFPDEQDKNGYKIYLDSVDDIYKYKTELINFYNRFL